MSELWFVVPALDERESLPGLAERLAAACAALGEAWRVVLVDDGSTDGTADVARALFGARGRVLVHEVNRGPGGAMDTGLRHVLGPGGAADDDLVVTLEADGTSDLGILARLLELARTSCDVALASPYAAGGGVVGTSLYRRVLSAGANVLCERLLDLRGIRTYSSFYRVHRVAALRRVLDRYGERMIEERGFAYAVELLTKLVRTGARCAEVPMVLDGTRRIGQSRMRIGRTVRAYLRLFARLGVRDRLAGRS